jgi:phosphatidylglycerophosphatase A
MRQWIVTFGGAGKSPIAPGTAGSLATAAVVYLVYLAGRSFWLDSPIFFQVFLLVGVLLASFGMVQLGPWAVEFFCRKDPGPVVLDEAAGLCLTMLLLPLRPDSRELWVVLAAFVSFRLFDVTKPPPCRLLEKLPMGWGILMDDLMAGVYANLLCQVALRLLVRL